MYKPDKLIRTSFLPYGRQLIEEDDIQAVTETLRGEMLTTGPKIGEFEKALADYCGVPFAVTISNGTAALHAAAYAAEIGPGDEVITTPITFAASANCVLYQGGTPVFADIDSKTYNIDPKSIEAKITSKTKAVIPVDFTGQPAKMDDIREIAKKYNLLVIEDAAHSIGAEYKGKSVGQLAHMTTMSYHPVKQITCGEGGAILTSDEELYRKLSVFRTHGIVRGAMMEAKDAGGWFYEQQELGYNYRLTDIQAALGLSQLHKVDRFIARRREIAAKYSEAFQDFDLLTVPAQDPAANSSWHLYVIRLELEKLTTGRKEIFAALQSEKLGVQVHYIPVYYHPYYQRLGYKKGICPVAEDLYERIISLPLFPGMAEQDIADVIAIVYKVLNYYRR